MRREANRSPARAVGGASENGKMSGGPTRGHLKDGDIKLDLAVNIHSRSSFSVLSSSSAHS